MRAWPLLVLLLACVNSQHAEVKLANNPAGVDCYARCVSTPGPSSQAVMCVAACPGAHREDGDCKGGGACVEHREISKGKTALIVIGGVVLVGLAAGAGP